MYACKAIFFLVLISLLPLCCAKATKITAGLISAKIHMNSLFYVMVKGYVC